MYSVWNKRKLLIAQRTTNGGKLGHPVNIECFFKVMCYTHFTIHVFTFVSLYGKDLEWLNGLSRWVYNNNNNGPNGHLFYVGGDLMMRRGMLPIIHTLLIWSNIQNITRMWHARRNQHVSHWVKQTKAKYRKHGCPKFGFMAITGYRPSDIPQEVNHCYH